MEIVVIGRHTEIADWFRELAESKLAKIEQYDPRVQHIDVEVTREHNPRQSSSAERVEITIIGKGPVIRAEASAADRYSALDLAVSKLMERMRRENDRRKGRSKAARRADIPVDLGSWAPDDLPPVTLSDAPEPEQTFRDVTVSSQDVTETALGDSPITIREKVHPAKPMSVKDAIAEMELVGHPFYLFLDAATGTPSVLYSRHGWTYGIIRLGDVEE
jgi:ribosomal subunit interface protein